MSKALVAYLVGAGLMAGFCIGCGLGLVWQLSGIRAQRDTLRYEKQQLLEEALTFQKKRLATMKEDLYFSLRRSGLSERQIEAIDSILKQQSREEQ
jgi:hypothetical protein